MKGILLKFKDIYLDCISKYKDEKGNYEVTDAVGFCFPAYRFLSREEDKLFQEYLSEYKKKRRVFYNFSGEKVKAKNQFLWNPKDVQVRLDWLDKQIEKLSKESINQV